MPRCHAKVFTGTWFRESQCARGGKYVEDGQHYCYQHRPSFIKAKDKAASDKFNTEIDEQRTIHQQARAFPIAMAVLRKLAKDHKDARTLTGAVALEYQELTAAALAQIEKEMGL